MDPSAHLIEAAKRDAFGEMAERCKTRIVGSGVSETLETSLNVLEDPTLLENMRPAWTENRAMLVCLFERIYRRSLLCPGHNQPQCCGATDNQSCAPKWREREDPEWYALEINKYIGLVDQRLSKVTPVTGALIADEAFELGCLLTEARIKFRWDDHAKRGEKIAQGAKLGGEMRRGSSNRRQSVNETVFAVDALIQGGATKSLAYSRVGHAQGVSEQTIGKEYRREKKLR